MAWKRSKIRKFIFHVTSVLWRLLRFKPKATFNFLCKRQAVLNHEYCQSTSHLKRADYLVWHSFSRNPSTFGYQCLSRLAGPSEFATWITWPGQPANTLFCTKIVRHFGWARTIRFGTPQATLPKPKRSRAARTVLVASLHFGWKRFASKDFQELPWSTRIVIFIDLSLTYIVYRGNRFTPLASRQIYLGMQQGCLRL
jgi:hypothetical protein